MLSMPFKVLFVALLLAAVPLVAQEAGPADDNEAAEEAAGPIIGSDDADLDLQGYEDDDDDFVPTEEVPADQAIPFPSDI